MSARPPRLVCSRHRIHLLTARIRPGHYEFGRNATAAALRDEIRRQRTLGRKAPKVFSHGPPVFVNVFAQEFKYGRFLITSPMVISFAADSGAGEVIVPA